MNGPVRLLADTQIVIWYVTDPERLTATATRAIEEATERDEAVGVLAFALVEMIYAVEKTTNPLTACGFRGFSYSDSGRFRTAFRVFVQLGAGVRVS